MRTRGWCCTAVMLWNELEDKNMYHLIRELVGNWRWSKGSLVHVQSLILFPISVQDLLWRLGTCSPSDS